MARYDTLAVPSVKEDKGSGKIDNISIRVAENGFSYCVYTDRGKSKDYVYEDIEDVMSAIKDDLKSPHIRLYGKKKKKKMKDLL